ncbi:MAG: AAA family ATPase [Paludibacteraceae bacterium]|nr:AAA family ATPase [Paludibacteraceae bacterium]
MGNLFEESDFSLFTQYKGKTQSQAPEAQTPLRNLYDKLGKIIDGLRNLNYHCEITRNPLMQGGPGTMKYAEYHWSRIYPQQQDIYNGCKDKIFFVIGTAEDGVNIHIDSYSSKGYVCNEVADKIKNNTWYEILPQDASRYSCDDYVKMADDYIKENWRHFNLFGKEFNIIECIKEINHMEMDNIKRLLLGNYNLILTGAPGTGKTYLAKKIAEAIGANKDTIKMVQFHPSYDYTDFVEGLRPIKQGNTLGFQRQDGVFKDFCKKAINSVISEKNNSEEFDPTFEQAYSILLSEARSLKEIKGCRVGKFHIESRKIESTTPKGDIITFVGHHPVNKNSLYKLYKFYGSLSKMNFKKDMIPYTYNINPSNLPCFLTSVSRIFNIITEKEIHSNNDKVKKDVIVEDKKYVFIIDEINRGEISKIFGELFYSIDSGYRGIKGRVETQYQNLVPEDDMFSKGFYIPKNVYIIGTMNDIDRSVESMDFAMRRRFAWKEISAKSRQSMLDEDEAWGNEGKPSEEVISEMKVRMDNLNACIIDQYGDEELGNKDKIGLTKAYQIGAAYFLKYILYNDFEELWTNHLEGLLYEYLRGKTNIDEKIEKLHQAYNDTATH